VKLRRDRVIVVLEYKSYVYNFADLKLVDHIETTLNSKGLCALGMDPANHVLVCPGLQKGHVRVELYDSKTTHLIPAHESSLACLALNVDGTRLATASELGTLIRVFDTQNGTCLHELRRGADRAEIYSLAFHPRSEWLACSSDKGTVHIFSLEQQKHEETGEAPSNPRSSLSFLKRLLPKYFSSMWSFAQFRVPDVRCIVAFGSEPNSLVVVGADGSFYKALYDPATPGQECVQTHYTKFIGE